MNGYAILTSKGTKSKDRGQVHARKEFDKFRPIQDASYISDFDKLVDKTIAVPLKSEKFSTHQKERSTTQRMGSTSKPTALSEHNVTSMPQPQNFFTFSTNSPR